MIKRIYTILLATLLFGAVSVLPTKAFADCQPIYGGGQTCTTNYSFIVNKLVQVPGKGGGQYVDNLSVNDPKYSPSQTVNYEIIITNTGNNNIPTLNVNDTFPQFINFVSGPGNFDSNTKILSFTINNLDAGKSQTYYLSGKVEDANNVSQGIVCVANQASATDQNGVMNSDSAQACIQNTTTPSATKPIIYPAPTTVKKTPPTGAEMFSLVLLIPGALGGFMLRKKSINKLNLKGGEK